MTPQELTAENERLKLKIKTIEKERDEWFISQRNYFEIKQDNARITIADLKAENQRLTGLLEQAAKEVADKQKDIDGLLLFIKEMYGHMSALPIPTREMHQERKSFKERLAEEIAKAKPQPSDQGGSETAI